MAHSHRSSGGRGAHYLGAVATAISVAVVVGLAVLVVVLRSGGHHGHPPETVAATSSHSVTPRTGSPLDLSTPEGYTYRMASVRGGSNGGAAYIDYVLTNTGTKPELLDFPGDLFVKQNLVSPGAQCMPQPGAPSDVCTVRDRSQIINDLGSAAPTAMDGDQYLAANSSYLVRVITDAVLTKPVGQADLGLYVWNPRFVPSRQATLVPFP